MEHSLLCGLGPTPGAPGSAADGAGAGAEAGCADGDFLVRTILGATEQGAIYVGEPDLEAGRSFRFHVRSRQSAQADIDAQLQRYRLERQFSAGSAAGLSRAPLAALLFSCNGRGERLFGVANHDSEMVQAAVGAGGADRIPLGGFFANGEIGPVGIRLGGGVGSQGAGSTYLHGFTSVVALLYTVDEW